MFIDLDVIDVPAWSVVRATQALPLTSIPIDIGPWLVYVVVIVAVVPKAIVPEEDSVPEL